MSPPRSRKVPVLLTENESATTTIELLLACAWTLHRDRSSLARVALVEWTSHLKTHFPVLGSGPLTLAGATVAEVLAALEQKGSGDRVLHLRRYRTPAKARQHFRRWRDGRGSTTIERSRERGHARPHHASAERRVNWGEKGMSGRLLIGTRKGTFIAENGPAGWKLRLAGHAGTSVNFALADPESGASVGCTRLWALGRQAFAFDGWRADLGGRLADQVSARRTLPGAPDPDEEQEGEPTRFTIRPATLLKLWVLAFGPGGRVWTSAPFRVGSSSAKTAGKASRLNRPLWNHESRGGDLFSGDGLGQDALVWDASLGWRIRRRHSLDRGRPARSSRILVAISTAGVLETTDGGKSWRGRNRAHDQRLPTRSQRGMGPRRPRHPALFRQSRTRLAAEPRRRLLQLGRCCHLEEGVSQPEQGVHFGFPVAVDETDGRTAWLVPAVSDQARMAIGGGLFVARTTNGGESWQQLRRRPSARERVRRRLPSCAGGQRRPKSPSAAPPCNLYVSSDRGDSWQTLATNLPPIYSVRFG